MKRIDGLIPGAAEHDEFGQHCVKLLKRSLEVGMDAAVREEFENPTWDDPDWCRLISARIANQRPAFEHDDDVMFRCVKCHDTGFIVIDEIAPNGQAIRTGYRCDPCPFMRWLAVNFQRKQELEGNAKRRSKLAGA